MPESGTNYKVIFAARVLNMENCEPLVWYGILVIIVTGCFIIIPFLRKKTDLISAWHLLLLGIAIYLGLGSIDAAISPITFPGTEWFQPSKEEVNWFLAASTIFLVSLFLFYYFDPFSKALAKRCLNKWPPITTPVILYVLVACVLVAVLAPIAANVVFINKILLNLDHKAIVFSCVFSFFLWYRNPRNPFWLGLFVGVFLLSSLLAVLAGGGRRIVLAVILGPVLVVYFLRIRHWRPTRAMVVVGVAATALLIVGTIYASIRHFDRTGGRRERSAEHLFETLKAVSEQNWLQRINPQELLTYVTKRVVQENVHYALLADHFVRTGEMEQQPLNTFVFLLVYPIPRTIWPEKPRSLSYIIVRDIVKTRKTEWGCGISGHATFEGGLWVAPLLAYLAVLGVRAIDDPLQRQPTNPFLIALFVTASTHVLGWPRGDVGVFGTEIAECFVFAIGLGVGGRLLFGTARNWQPQRRTAPMEPFGLQSPAR